MNVPGIFFSRDDIRHIAEREVERRNGDEHDYRLVVGIGVDAALEYVVEWLGQRGDADAADALILAITEV